MIADPITPAVTHEFNTAKVHNVKISVSNPLLKKPIVIIRPISVENPITDDFELSSTQIIPLTEGRK